MKIGSFLLFPVGGRRIEPVVDSGAEGMSVCVS